MAFLEVKNVSQTFSHQKQPQVLFENLNFEIQTGEFVTLLGPSGCGKSTLLRFLGNLVKPSSGQIHSQSQKRSFVFQEPRLLPWRTCLENTLLPIEIEKGKISKLHEQEALKLLKMFRLQEAFAKFPHQLSGGMKMRTALARSLVIEPDLLLFDEPFAALDEMTRLHLQAEFRSQYEKSKWTVLFVTHSIEEACYLSSRILLFSKSRNNLLSQTVQLPKERTAALRDDLQFFEEAKRIRHLFERET